jgi:thiamine biosynthesis lipoprotein ApbE
MEKLNSFIEKHFKAVVLVILLILFLQNCGDSNKNLNKKVITLSNEIDSLKQTTVTKRDLQIEGLKSEKRMIQSTDRKMIDVNRQSQIDKELESLSK